MHKSYGWCEKNKPLHWIFNTFMHTIYHSMKSDMECNAACIRNYGDNVSHREERMREGEEVTKKQQKEKNPIHIFHFKFESVIIIIIIKARNYAERKPKMYANNLIDFIFFSLSLSYHNGEAPTSQNHRTCETRKTSTVPLLWCPWCFRLLFVIFFFLSFLLWSNTLFAFRYSHFNFFISLLRWLALKLVNVFSSIFRPLCRKYL